jgi:hypothetical protein
MLVVRLLPLLPSSGSGLVSSGVPISLMVRTGGSIRARLSPI